MWVWVDRLGALVLDASLSAAALLSLVALAMLGCRQPCRRVWLARAGVVGALALLPLVALGPLPRVHVLRALCSPDLLAHPLLTPAEPSPDGPRTPDPGAGCRPRSWRWAARALTILYLAGVGTGLAALVLGWWGVGWLLRRSGAPSPAALALYESLCPGGALRPRLQVSFRARRPVLVGVFRPTILIPAALDAPGASQALRLTLLHELAHAEHADPCFGLAVGLARALWFFLPPLWWVRAQLTLDQEFLADRRAALGVGPLASYASALLGLAAPGAAPSGGAAEGSGRPGLSGSPLTQRVLMLVGCPFPVEARPPLGWRRSRAVLVALATLACSTLCVRPPEPVVTPPRPGSRSPLRSFQMARLNVPAQPANVRGRAPLFELPIRLPAEFDLSVEVWGDPAALARTRVVGLRLGTAGASADASPRWHQVRVRRDRDGARLTVDDLLVDTDPELDVTTTWLAVEAAPDAPGRFRRLVLRW